MNARLTPTAVLLLVIPTFLWAGNAVVGRVISEMVPPITLNFIRWFIAFFILAAFGGQILRRGSALWRHWRHYAMLGLLGIGMYNALQYMALHSSSPINVTLVNASMPIWMLLVGRLFFHATITARQISGAVLSLLGVAIILSRGDLNELLQFRFVIGDIYMVIATIAWAFYSWLLSQDKHEPEIKQNWSTLLLAQVTFGLMWSGAFAAGEWALTDWHIDWSWGLVLAMLYVAIGPAIIAFRCWGLGVQRVGPATAGFFANLMPLFAAILSMIFLDQAPEVYHGVAFLLIVGGILYASRQSEA
ncbi:MAG: DMT family transporter [Alcaligenaceae bacterium]|uniref:DMT family transporter n=1 Tax=Paenalcaligenes sp. TaxID=1966342 RepID=UPI0016B4F041|nr:DMT family transporter [Paenalcaligenes sp.]NLJ62146.1 DMT family transporter [Alcaligenaceae bacterium]